MIKSIRCAELVELADTQDLGSCAVRCAGSSPVIRTKKENQSEHFLSSALTGFLYHFIVLCFSQQCL